MNVAQRPHPGHREPVTLTISTARDLAPARSALRSWLQGSITPAEVDEILLASGEAWANAIEHGVAPITVMLAWDDDTLRVTIRDAGVWQAPTSGRTTVHARGLGIPIMKALADSLTFETIDGTAVTFTRRFAV